MTLLDALLKRVAYPRRAALVVAHPDDETIAAGGSLHLLADLVLVHVTDGAPRGLDDAARAGFGTPAAYAAARRAELDAALALADAAPVRAALDVPDQDASLCMGAITARLATLFDAHGVDAVLTHAYEGGHPDHDAVAFCVAQAAGGREVVEFPAYHAAEDGSLTTGRFLPGQGQARPLSPWERVGVRDRTAHPQQPGQDEALPVAAHALTPHPNLLPGGEGAAALTAAERSRKQAMLACFHTQREFLQHFPTGAEHFRPAPAYDFSLPPHPGPLNYERWGWPLTGARWRELAGQARPEAPPEAPSCAA